MILEILFAILVILITFVTAYCDGSYFKARFQRKNQASLHQKTLSTELKHVDLGFLGTLRAVWKYRALLWNDVPPYEGLLDLLKDHKVRMLRIRYVVNWSTAARLVVCSDLETIKQVLHSSTWPNRFHKEHYLRIGTFGKPLGVAMGDDLYWKEARKAVMTAFRETNLLKPRYVESLYLPEVNILLEQLRRGHSSGISGGSNNFIFSPSRLFANPLLQINFKSIFGRRLFPFDPMEGTLEKQIHYNNSIFSVGSSTLDMFPFLKYFHYLHPTARSYVKLCGTIHDITDLERDRRMKEPTRDSSPRDILDSLLKTLNVHAESHSNHFTFESLQVVIRDLLFGSDSSNAILQHMILFMATHQDKQRTVQEEIDQFIVEHDRLPTYEDRNRIIYTQAMISETLRIGSAIPINSRVNSEDCTIGGLRMKKGTYFIPAFIGCHTSESLWEDPLEFRPERFISPDRTCIVNAEKMLPFSTGPRSCPAELISRVGIFTFTVALLREFKWEMSDERPLPSKKCLKGLIRAPVPYYVKISPRNCKIK